MNKIPQIDSIDELAKFWDAHDLTDFEEELEEVDGPVFDRGDQTVVQIHLPLEQAEAVRRIAKAKGMDEAELVREWVREKLRAS